MKRFILLLLLLCAPVWAQITIGTQNIRNGAVTAVKIAPSAIRASYIAPTQASFIRHLLGLGIGRDTPHKDNTGATGTYPSTISSNPAGLTTHITDRNLPPTNVLYNDSGLNSSNLNSGTATPTRLSTGTPSASTVLNGDGTWKAVPSGTVSGVTDGNLVQGTGGAVADSGMALTSLNNTASSVVDGLTKPALAKESLLAASNVATMFNVRAYGAKGDGKTDDAAAIQAAIDAAEAAGGGKVYLPAGDYHLRTAPCIYTSFISFVGEGRGVTTLSPAAGVDGLDVDPVSHGYTSVNQIEITDLSISGGGRGIHISSSGNGFLWSTLARVNIANPTGECLYIDATAVQNCTFDDVYTDGGTYGGRFTPSDGTFNNNVFRECKWRQTTTAGVEINGLSGTNIPQLNTFIGNLFESNDAVGLNLWGVRGVVLLSCHFENNGRTGDSPNVSIKGRANPNTWNIDFINTILVTTGAGQTSKLAVQVASDYCSGPIAFRDCYLFGTYVDLGTYATPTVCRIEGDRPIAVLGTHGDAVTGTINQSLNGKFAYWSAGASAAPDGWSAGTGAVARTTGSRYGYAVQWDASAAAQTFSQTGMEAILKPNCTYTLSYRKKVTALTATNVIFGFVNGGAWTTTKTYAATDADWVRDSVTFTTPASLTNPCGLSLGYQTGAGAATVLIDEVNLVEGGDVTAFSPGPEDYARYAPRRQVTITPSADAANVLKVTKSDGTTTVLQMDTSTGRLCVGTGTSQAVLTLQGAQSVISATSTTGTNTTGLSLRKVAATGDGWDVLLDGGTNDYTWTSRVSTIASERMRLTAAGNLGIGTSGSPAASLSIGGTTGNATIASTGIITTPALVVKPQTLSDGTSIAWNAASGAKAKVTLTDSGHTIANPRNIADGMRLVLFVVQDATGSRTVTWGTIYKFAGGTAPTLTTTANAKDIFTFESDGTNLYCVSQALDVR